MALANLEAKRSDTDCDALLNVVGSHRLRKRGFGCLLPRSRGAAICWSLLSYSFTK